MINVLKNKHELVIKNGYLYLKNYKRIVDINDKNILIMLDNKSVNIKGNNLIVCSMDEYDIVIKGNINIIEYINE